MRIRYLLLTVLSIALFGCTSGTTNTHIQQPTTILTETIEQRATQTPEDTKTPLPVSTLQQPTASETPFWTSTPEPESTLNALQADQLFRAVLQDSAGCQAPCFFDITPGQTTLEEALEHLRHLGQPILTASEAGFDFYSVYYQFEQGLSIWIDIGVSEDLVVNVTLSISPVEPEKTGLQRIWESFSPQTLIKQYGAPENVDFSVGRARDADASPQSWYHMVAYYPEVHLIVEYSYGYIDPALGELQVCPSTDHFSLVRVWFGQTPDHPPLPGVPLEAATELTLDEYVQLMTGNPENACFKLNSDQFP